MSRRRTSQQAVNLAHEMRAHGHGYGAIRKAIKAAIGIEVGESTVRDWVTYLTRRPKALPRQLLDKAA